MTVGTEPQVTLAGGVAGTAVALEDLELAAAVLDREADALVGLAGRLPDLVLTVDVVTFRALRRFWRWSGTHAVIHAARRAERELTAALGPMGALGEGLRLRNLATSVRDAVASYREVDTATAAFFAAAQDATMHTVARLAPVLALGALHAHLWGVPLSEVADRALFDAPWLVDVVAGGSDGFLTGLGVGLPGHVVLAAAAATADRPYPPRNSQDAVATLAAVVRMVERLDEAGREVEVIREPVASEPVPAPSGVGGMLAGLEDVAADSRPGLIRVLEVPQDFGRSAWIVQVPGTESTDPVAGQTPFDATTDVDLMVGRQTLLAGGIDRALGEAKAASGTASDTDPVLVVGHSLGGMLAAAVASDPVFRASHNVTHVITAGSPISGFPLPDDVRVLALEHVQDPIPRLDGIGNPDRRSVTTVTRDLRDDPDQQAQLASKAHDLREYVETAEALDALSATSDDAALADWVRTTRPFDTADSSAVIARDYRIVRRVTQSSP